jgi:hypothetical protein
MDVDRMVPFDIAHQIEVPLERDVRIVSALQQNLDSPNRLALVDLAPDLLETQNVAFPVFGPAVERAELAVSNAHIGVVDVPIDDVGDNVLGVLQPTLGIGQLA